MPTALRNLVVGFCLITLAAVAAILWWHKPINIWASRINPQALDFWKAIATVLVALIAALVAASITYILQRRQIVIAEQKLKLDLFEKRFEVFSNINAAVGDVLRTGGLANLALSVKDEARQKFLQATAPVRYLFDEDAHSFIQTEVMWRVNVYLGYDDGNDHPVHSGSEGENWEDYLKTIRLWLTDLRERELHSYLGNTMTPSRPASM